MKIAFNPSTVAALTTPPNNKDITFDLRGRNIFARGVKFYGTDTNTWRDIKINNVSIGSHTLDLQNGSNTTLTNTNGVVTINSTWRPVVDNLTSDSTTSSLSAKQGKVLKALIDGKSNSDHNHDGRYVRYYAVTALDCNNLAAGLTAARISATNAAHTNHSAYLYISDVGTPFQIQIPDSNIPYIYKRYYGSGKWSGWFKLNAGYADSAGYASSAGNADTLGGAHLIKNGSGTGIKQVYYFGSRSNNSSYVKLGTLKTVSATEYGTSKVMFTVKGGIDFGGTNESVYEVAASTRGSIQVTSTLVRGNRELKFGYVSTSSNVEIWMAYDGVYRGVTEVEVSSSTNFTLTMTETTTKPSGFVEGFYRILAATADNIASATKLQTPRTIWGQSFDGTGNVSGSLSGVGHIQFSADNSYSIGTTTSEAAHTYTRQVWARHLNASRVYAGDTNLYIGYSNTAEVKFFSGTKQSGDGSNERMTISTNGNVGVGITSPAYKLHVVGDIYSSGYVRASSGFIKGSSSDSYVLLGGGGHKAISDFAMSTHTHGLLHSDLTVTLANTTTNSGWSMINSLYNGFLLKSIRTQKSAPNWIEDNHAAGICFGGADTKGVVSVAYDRPYIKFAGGNGPKPGWWIRLSGISEATYNLANFNADTLDGEHASSFVRAGYYGGKDLNELDTYSFIRSVYSSVPSTSPKGNTGWYNVIQLVHKNGAEDGPSYIGQIALGMTTNTNDMFFRGKRTDPWKTVIHSGNYTEFINNYYWANVKISTSSSTTTSPTFSNVYLRNSLYLNYKGSNSIYNGPVDSASGVGGSLNNLVFSSWFGVSFTTSCAGFTYTNKNAVSINCRTGQLYAREVQANGFMHTGHNNNDAVLLAGGGYKTLKDFIFLNKSYTYTDTEHYNLNFHKLSGICNNLVWVDGHVKGSITKFFVIDPAVFPYRYDEDPSLNTTYRMTGNNFISIDAAGIVTIYNETDHKQRVGFFYTGRA